MEISRYTKASKFEFIKSIDEEIKLTNLQREKLDDFLQYYEYIILKRDAKIKQNSLIRLTSPFYLLSILLIFISMPFKWLLTGTSQYKRDSKFVTFMYKWKNILNF